MDTGKPACDRRVPQAFACRSETVEICHERLITQGPWWQYCLSAAAIDMRPFARLMERAADWASKGKEGRNLATGGELDTYREIAARRKLWLSDNEIGFVGAAAQRAMIRRIAAIAAVLALVVFAGVMTYFWSAANQSHTSRLCCGTSCHRRENNALIAEHAANAAKNGAVNNESRALAALAEAAIPGSSPHDAFKLTVAAKLKIVVLQLPYNLSDEQTEYLVRDRLSFMRFLGLELADRWRRTSAPALLLLKCTPAPTR